MEDLAKQVSVEDNHLLLPAAVPVLLREIGFLGDLGLEKHFRNRMTMLAPVASALLAMPQEAGSHLKCNRPARPNY